jgi:two-component system, LuxR family, sensor kinase FixL
MSSTAFKGGRVRILAGIAGLIVLIAAADRYIGNKASLGIFYIIPMVMGATALPWSGIVALAVVCSALRSLFDIPSPHIEQLLRFIFATLAYASAGLLVATLIRNRELTIAHLANIRREQELRREAEEQLRILADSSPAAILTMDGKGVVLAANRAANTLFMIPSGESMKGRAIGRYLPVLEDALQVDPEPDGLRAAAQAQGQRENHEVFLASTWFSAYATDDGKRLAAIVVDSSEEMRDREEQSFHQISEANRMAASAVFHEVRNLSGAFSVMLSNLQTRHGIGGDEDFQALQSLATGIEKVASVELQSRVENRLDAVDLQSVLDDLRIVIEPDWREIDGAVHWPPPRAMPQVLATRHGLLQVFLNLAHNSRRAVEESRRRELSVTVSEEESRIIVRFLDTGSGVKEPGHLFAPFQPEANGAGLGLYVSRAVVRSYGGDLRHEARTPGSCFAVELQAA